ncbi:MAG: response regulator, partial [Collinsella sp.]|nr:response regulator [Collinsella sp.]
METRILVVDDERAITDLVGIYLRKEGYQVTLAYTGAEAAREILANEFDLAILDI